MALRSLVFVTLFLGACGGKSAADYQKEAQGALDGGDADKAMQIADEGLKSAGDDKAAAWRLEQVRLDALAKQGKGKEVAEELGRLAGNYGPQVTPALYRALAEKVKAGGGTSIDVLDAGKKKWPDDKTFDEAIAEAQKTADPAEIERLKALGYL